LDDVSEKRAKKESMRAAAEMAVVRKEEMALRNCVSFS
jgi:hypothetical protein